MNRIAWLEQKIERAGALLAQDQSRLRERPHDLGCALGVQSMQAHVNDLRHQLYLARAARAREVVGLRLRGDRLKSGSIPLTFLTRLGDALGGALSALAWRAEHGKEVRRLPATFVSRLDLRLAGVTSGSTRLVFTGNTMPDLFGDSPVETGLRTVFAVLEAETPDELTEHVAEAGARATRKISDLLHQFARERCGAELTWTDSREQAHHWAANPPQIATLHAGLAALTSAPPEELLVEGEVELLAKTGRIGIRASDGAKLTVRYPRDLYEAVQALRLGQHGTFKLLLNRVYNPNTRHESSTYTLLDATPETTP